jgi:hypothetical protein
LLNTSDCYLDLKIRMRELSKGAQARVPVPLKFWTT